ncbi:hypothetical protein U2F10_02840 [Leptothoe sp. EHU-05/26/07-4]
MPYPIIPLEIYYSNPINQTPQFTRIEMGRGGVVHRSRSQIINNARRSWSFQGVLKNRDAVEDFLRDRKGKPFRYEGGNYTCLDWDWEWLVFVSDGAVAKGVWRLTGTFMEDFNPEIL